jgi:hypothetical protein
MNFLKLLSAEFEQHDYKDLYENHSHQSQIKTGGYVNISLSQSRSHKMTRGL